MFKFLSVLIFIYGVQLTHCDSSCGDWTPYKDEKCFKLLTKLVVQQDGLNACHQLEKESVIATIKTKDEQESIEKILKNSGIADNVWIGVQKIENKFKNSDKTDLVFTNWLKDRPVPNNSGHGCVEISTDDQTFGKWIDEKCQKQNAVLCEKIQAWSNIKIQSILLETRSTLTKVLDNLVPIGFIYVQLFNQSDPQNLWPKIQWKDVTSSYSGLFFRAEGGQSASFGQIQPQNTRNFEIISADNNHDGYGPLNITNEYNEYYIYTGGNTGTHVGIKFRHFQDEIRPTNTAIRIWQRIK